MQLLPSPYLSNIVKHFLILESDEDGIADHRLFPDGNPGMVFHYGDPFCQYAAGTMLPFTHPRSFIYGQVSKFQHIVSAGKTGMLIVVLQPDGLHALLGIPAYELMDAIVSLQNIWGRAAKELEAKVLNISDNLLRIQLIEDFLLKKRNKCNPHDTTVKNSLHLIYQHHGQLQVNELTKHLQISERQLERTFRENIGITPKHFSNIIKLHYFLKTLQRKSSAENLTQLVYECGYYDQAHLIRAFKKNVGLTPRQYLFKTHLLAVNFIQFPVAG